ncbi:hypothetical protein F7734_04075 [Scytonema sp. UIC 10036]|uniref:hypothetical protein n=1 Tax=Scytonema sp. UIC 10036 TaxID=2304196 RepID=UPI0012DACF2F|nr:hypothetical protein [Scytonema sp. UIC 10036]MUG91702.1 hypothetical protein [Scytonema sp. UIC 10036]
MERIRSYSQSAKNCKVIENLWHILTSESISQVPLVSKGYDIFMLFAITIAGETNQRYGCAD